MEGVLFLFMDLHFSDTVHHVKEKVQFQRLVDTKTYQNTNRKFGNQIEGVSIEEKEVTITICMQSNITFTRIQIHTHIQVSCVST